MLLHINGKKSSMMKIKYISFCNFQLYHGENKLIFSEMMRSALH
jgi:hypothetical protein